MPAKGKSVTESQRKKMAAAKKDKKNPNYKDGKWTYLTKKAADKKGKMGDKIRHHKNGNPLNNDPDNLEVISRAQHNKMHDRDGGRGGKKHNRKTHERRPSKLRKKS